MREVARRVGATSTLGLLVLSATLGCARKAEIRLASTSAYAYRERVAEQVAVDSLEREAQALRFRLKSFIMREAWGADDIDTRESWAVPVGYSVRGGVRHVAIVTTRCVLDYRYPLNKKMPSWSNLALFTSAGPPPNRQDVTAQVFRLGTPDLLPGVSGTYDPKRDAWLFNERRYLEGPAGERYFSMLKSGRLPSASADLVMGNWGDSSGVDLAVVHIPLTDPGTSALRPERSLGVSDPVPALRAAFAPSVSLWGDTFNFSLVSNECMKHAQADYQNIDRERRMWKGLAITAGVALAANLVAPGFVGMVGDPRFVERLARTVTKQALAAMWRSIASPLLGTSARGASWNQLGRLVIRMALADGSVREYVVAGLNRLGLSDTAAAAVVSVLEALLKEPQTRVATMERATGAPVAAVLSPGRQVDFAAELIRSGRARLDLSDREVLGQQPTLLQLAQQAIADPSTATRLVQDEAYRWALSEAARELAIQP